MNRNKRTAPYVAAAFCAIVAFAPHYAAAGKDGQGPVVSVVEGAEPEKVFDWKTQSCATWDVPDVPARAFRDFEGNVNLIASHFVNRALKGPDLDHVRPDCRIIFQGKEEDDPSRFDDRGWLTSFYTENGRQIYALIHNEFQGHRRKNLCPSGKYLNCWSNSVTLAKSDDGGKSFSLPDGRRVVAAGERYKGDVGKNVGFFGPSNMVKKDGFLYSFIFAQKYGSQKHGACLIRTNDVKDPASWRAWDGEGFGYAFADPYAIPEGDVSKDKGCAPVAPGTFGRAVSSLVEHPRTGTYIAVFTAAREEEGGPGIFYATSSNLTDWSEAKLLLHSPTFGKRSCGDVPVTYPSILDPDSHSPTFSDVDGRAYLYFTRLNQEKCKAGPNRDLVRVPIDVSDGR